MHERGRGRRAVTVAVVALVIAMCAPELVASAGAATTRNTSRIQLHQLTRSSAKRRKPHRKLKRITSTKKHAILVRYIRKHPGVIAAHERRPSVTLAVKLRAKATARARARVRKPKRTVRRHAPARPAAKKGKKKKKKKGKASSSTSKRRLAIIFGGLVVGGLALFLIASSVMGGPRSRARARARRRQRAYAPR